MKLGSAKSFYGALWSTRAVLAVEFYSFLGQKSISPYKLDVLDAKIRMANRMANSQSPGFPHDFAKNNRRYLKMSCIDAS